MMKLFKITLILALFTAMSYANNTPEVKRHEKSKTIRKEFSVNKNATLFIDNRYGNVNVTSWDQNRIEIDVKITVKGGSLSNVNDKLNGIDVAFQSSKDLVKAKTIIENNKSSWSWWKKNNTSFKIHYTVKMPITNNADFHNKYGNIELDELKGKSNINCDYGNIEIGKLHNTDNIIEINYCGSSEIDYMHSGNISADYSTLKIDKSKKLKVSSDYSTMKVGNVESINFNSDYGSVVIRDAANILGNSDYAGVKIGTIRKNLTVDTDYGSVKIQNIKKGFEEINIEGSYAGIKLGTDADNNFKFNVSLSYAGFNYPSDKVNMTKSIKKSSKKYYEGAFGNNSSNSSINIKSSYGGVTLKLND
ncbi:hypothetical protein [Tenacibaculum sp. MAR_2009_124]|uniref:hypothetical protein n=1 Tax=Tenacibaculum sp. MAR_2009_124 TaxID=1250059 RepID=UPI001160092F|nr:hypothetical protein [Tenacibaculum sp. MAR_2009_124]